MLRMLGAVVDKRDGAGTVTTIVNCVPFTSVTITLASPPAVFGRAVIVSEESMMDALRMAGLELNAVYLYDCPTNGTPPETA